MAKELLAKCAFALGAQEEKEQRTNNHHSLLVGKLSELSEEKRRLQEIE